MGLETKEPAVPADVTPIHADIVVRLERIEEAIGHITRALGVVGEAVEKIEDKFGVEPDSDGNGGRGLIGDMRKTARDVQGLVDLRNKGIGAVAAVSLFGVLIIAGIVFWIQKVAPAAKAKVSALASAWGWA